MSESWRKGSIGSRLVLAAVLSVAAVPLGVMAPLSAAAYGVPLANHQTRLPAAALDSGPAAVRAANSPGHSPVPVFSGAYGVSCARCQILPGCRGL